MPSGVLGAVTDGDAEYTEALGISYDGSTCGMGNRGKRSALVVENYTATGVAIEAPGKFDASSAESILTVLQPGNL